MSESTPPRTEARTYPCGCVRGERLCPEAEALWHAANQAYRVAEAVGGKWDIYEEAGCSYSAHFGEAWP